MISRISRALAGAPLRAALAALVGALLPAPCHAGKTDRVTTRNGDVLSGEIKKFEFGSLRFKTDATDTISIKWDDVMSLTSPEVFQVSNVAGDRYLGTLAEGGGPREIVLVTGDGTLRLGLDDVVRIAPIEETFWARIDGSLSAGFSFTESSGVTQFTLGGNASSRRPSSVQQVSFSSIVTNQESGTTERHEFGYQYQRFLSHRYFALALATAERNDELGLDLRVYAGGGAGRRLIQTTHTELKAALGAVLSHERLADDPEPNEVVEATGAIGYQINRYHPRDLSTYVKLAMFRSVTDDPRFRGDFDATTNWEIIKDLTWSFTLYASYTSGPAEGADRMDYGLTAALGWTF